MSFDSKVPANTNQVKNLLSTSVIKGCVVTTSNIVAFVSADVTISEGTVRFVDNFTDQDLPNFKGDSKFPETTIIGVDLTSSKSIVIEEDLSVSTPVFTEFDTPKQRRVQLQIGVVGPQGDVALFFPIGYDMQATLLDTMKAVGTIRMSGLTLGPNGSNLSFDRAAGEEYTPLSVNHALDTQDPNTLTPTLVSPVPFFITFRDGSGGFILVNSQTTISPTIYDDGSPGASPSAPNGVVNNNSAQIFRVFELAGAFAVSFGQNVYISIAAAVNAIPTDSFDIAPFLIESSFRGFIVARGGALDLSLVADALFFKPESDFTTVRGE